MLVSSEKFCECTKYMILYQNIRIVVCPLSYLVNIRKYNDQIGSRIFKFLAWQHMVIFINTHLSRQTSIESNE